MMTTFDVIPASTAIQIAVAIWLYTHSLPPREHHLARGIACATAFALGSLAANAAVNALLLSLNQTTIFILIVASFVLVLGACIAYAMVCYEISFWQALFCATAAYTTQSLAAGISNIVETIVAVTGGVPTDGTPNTLVVILVTAVVYLACHQAFVRRIEHDGLVDIDDRGLLVVLAAVIFVNIVFNLANSFLIFNTRELGLYLVYGCIHAITSAFILFAEFRMLQGHQLEVSMAALEQLMADRERQYEISRSTIDAINMKCHDIRHQIRHLGETGVTVSQEALDDISHEVRVFDSTVKSGNDAIDTILTEKSLVCEREGIDMTCIADGAMLDFMRTSELYALLGNALDNAIEAVRDVEPGEGRSIGVSIARKASMALIHVENTFAHEPTFVDGLPQTTKGDTLNHGFGMRSMRMTVERYGGTLSAGTHGRTFFLNMLIPLPE